MTQSGRIDYLILELLAENTAYRKIEVPSGESAKRLLLRSLLNVRPPAPVSADFLLVQDAYLKGEAKRRGIVDISNLAPLADDLYLWVGDITRLRVDGIVNAANSKMLGCFVPNHHCIDNAIHTHAGIQLRQHCAELMAEQGHDEAVGGAKITPGFNLPCKYIIHTVGPAIAGRVTDDDIHLLESCYRACLLLGDQYHSDSIAFCCISTGEYHFPRQAAAEIAMATVSAYKKMTHSNIKVVFNVFTETDAAIYRKLFSHV